MVYYSGAKLTPKVSGGLLSEQRGPWLGELSARLRNNSVQVLLEPIRGVFQLFNRAALPGQQDMLLVVLHPVVEMDVSDAAEVVVYEQIQAV